MCTAKRNRKCVWQLEMERVYNNQEWNMCMATRNGTCEWREGIDRVAHVKYQGTHDAGLTGLLLPVAGVPSHVKAVPFFAGCDGKRPHH